jgi:formiminotetrahydrofolate cyclodeaminase
VDSLLQNLPNGGAVVAVVAVVVLFLRRQEADIAVLREMSAEYRQHMSQIMAQGLTAHQETRAAIRELAEAVAQFRDACHRPEVPR